MGDQERRYDDTTMDERRRRDTYRVRRPNASRRRSRKPGGPGGMRQRRNKHWNW